MPTASLRTPLEELGRGAAGAVETLGQGASVFGEAVKASAVGRLADQPVRAAAILAEMQAIGLAALPIATLLSLTIGVMLAIQSLYSLGLFGAESFAYIGIGFATVREFAPLIVGILVAGRSGSAFAARVGTMTINQEVDALVVMGIGPVRYLVAPALIAAVVMVPALTLWSILTALLGAGLYVAAALDISLLGFFSDMAVVLRPGDLGHGMVKSAIFAVLIVVIGMVCGARVEGGAAGVGRATTRAVVLGISAVVVTDMLFALVVVRL